MRRGRDPSRSPSRARRPVWDNPGGQLPGTGIRGDGENLHDRRSTQRVRGTSPGSAVLTGESSSGRPSFQVNLSGSGSGGASSGGQVSACAGEERPSLFSDSGNRFSSFNPFAAALSSLSPAERYEAEYRGASEFLTRRLNEELQRAFEAGVPSSQVYPSPQVHHIGTPSEHTTSEGFRSVVSQRTPSVQSHPTSSPISFGPSTPVQSASAAPAGLLSSPGGMSDVGSTLTPPGLPLRDPPRMAGSYGVSLNDPVFGISSGSIPCENPGHRPMPAQAPIPPPPPQQGVGDPVAQLLVGQGAMSHLLIQMAQEMNRRASGQGAGDSKNIRTDLMSRPLGWLCKAPQIPLYVFSRGCCSLGLFPSLSIPNSYCLFSAFVHMSFILSTVYTFFFPFFSLRVGIQKALC